MMFPKVAKSVLGWFEMMDCVMCHVIDYISCHVDFPYFVFTCKIDLFFNPNFLKDEIDLFKHTFIVKNFVNFSIRLKEGFIEI